jgi:hypothetical protein
MSKYKLILLKSPQNHYHYANLPLQNNLNRVNKSMVLRELNALDQKQERT